MDQPTVPTGLVHRDPVHPREAKASVVLGTDQGQDLASLARAVVDLVHPRVVRAPRMDTDLAQDLASPARAAVDMNLVHPRVVRAPRVDMAQDLASPARAAVVLTTCSPRPLVGRDLPRVVRVRVGTDTEEIYEASKLKKKLLMKSKSNWNNKFLLSSSISLLMNAYFPSSKRCEFQEKKTKVEPYYSIEILPSSPFINKISFIKYFHWIDGNVIVRQSSSIFANHHRSPTQIPYQEMFSLPQCHMMCCFR